METGLRSLHKPSGLVNVSQLRERKLLFFGHVDFKKNVWKLASDLGLKCYVVGPVPKEPVQDRVAKYICYDLADHSKDQTHCDAIAVLVTSEIGDIDGCLTMYDDCIPLTALICTRLQKVGIPFSAAMAAKQKSLTFEALRNCNFFSTVSNCISQEIQTTETKPSSTNVAPDMMQVHGTECHQRQDSPAVSQFLHAVDTGEINDSIYKKDQAVANGHCTKTEPVNNNEKREKAAIRQQEKVSYVASQRERPKTDEDEELGITVSTKLGENGELCTAGNVKTLETDSLQNEAELNDNMSIQTKDTGLTKYTSRCVRVASVDDVKEASSAVGFPAVMKMEYGAGARGTKLVHNLQESEDHFQFLQELCAKSVDSMHKLTLGMGFKTNCVLMDFLKGSEHCVDLVAFHGELLLAVVTDKGPQCLPDTFHTVTIMPSLLSSNRQNDVITAAWDCCQALGLRHGVFDVDIMLTSSGPKLIEINARMGGYCQRDFARHCYGLDFFTLACMTASDIKPQFADAFCPVEMDVSTSQATCESDVQAAAKNYPMQTELHQTTTYLTTLRGGISNNNTSEKSTSTELTSGEKTQITRFPEGFGKSTVTEAMEEKAVTGATFERSDANRRKTLMSTSKAITASGVLSSKLLQKNALSPPVFKVPPPCCFIVGYTLYPRKHGAALKTTARTDTLQRLHDEGELLFLRMEAAVIDQADELPFCVLAVKGQSFFDARKTLDRLCVRFGIDAPELCIEHYAY